MLFSSEPVSLFFFFFNDTATTEIYTLSLHDALPILAAGQVLDHPFVHEVQRRALASIDVLSRFKKGHSFSGIADRKSTRLNSSHLVISYAVFCLKKKNAQKIA